MNRKEKAEPIVVGSNKNWIASINKGARERYWWALTRDGATFASSRTGLKTEEEATERALFLLHAIEGGSKLKSAVSERDQLRATNENLHRERDQMKRERDDARTKLGRIWWAMLAAAAVGYGAAVAFA